MSKCSVKATMPSNKKARAKAKKAAKAAEKAARNQCFHNDDETTQFRNVNESDVVACRQLTTDLYLNYKHQLHGNNEETTVKAISQLVSVLIWTHRETVFNNGPRKKLLREMLVSQGTTCISIDANEVDLLNTEVFFISYPILLLLLIVRLEVLEKYDSILDSHGLQMAEVREIVFDIIICPREVVRFFHRRNSCDCLKELYYHLKDNTKRTTFCT
jgi:hypothetical protein